MYNKIGMAVAFVLLTAGLVAAVVSIQTIQQAQAALKCNAGGCSGGQGTVNDRGTGGFGQHSGNHGGKLITNSGGAFNTDFDVGGSGTHQSCDSSGCTNVGGVGAHGR